MSESLRVSDTRRPGISHRVCVLLLHIEASEDIALEYREVLVMLVSRAGTTKFTLLFQPALRRSNPGSYLLKAQWGVSASKRLDVVVC